MKIYPNSLFWRISAIFLFFLLIVGMAYIWITLQTADTYFLHRHQQLNAPIAEAMIKEVDPYEEGQVRKESLHQIMHAMMAVNPAVEVYLLDTTGIILEHVAPYKTVKLEKVDLAPINQFLQTEGKELTLGDDPKEEGVQKVFSAAPVFEEEELVGYVYIILASQEYESVTRYLRAAYLSSMGGKNMLLTLVAALAIGLFSFWLITRNLSRVIHTVKRFKDGDSNARMPVENQRELKQLAVTFNEMAEVVIEDKRRQETLSKLRRELIANVSHDLRTPLAVIHGYAETLLIKGDTIGKEERQNYAQKVLDRVKSMEKMVKELFELSKLQAQQIKPNMEPFSLSELVQDVVYMSQVIAQRKQIELRPVFAAEQLIVYADLVLIERVLQNLLDNALKFTPPGGTVIVRLEKHERSAQVSLIDSGAGIPAEDLPHIFDRYHKAEHKMNGGGSGLGLAIVKKIIELHESKIAVESELNKGSTFTFSLPLYVEATPVSYATA